MAEAHGSETIDTETVDAAHDVQSKIKGAMSSRIPHFQEQADSLTLEGVRRLLEKDLEMDIYALDVHKGFIKQFLSECLQEGTADDNAPKSSGETEENDINSTMVASKLPGDRTLEDLEESRSEDEGKKEDSPVLGLMTGHKTKKAETGKEVLSETMIKNAIKKRETYIKSNSEEITMVGVRRFLEEDLTLDKHTLDPYKKLISGQIDMILNSSEASESAETKNNKKKSHSKPSKDDRSEESSHSIDDESEEEEDEVKPKKIIAAKRKSNNSEGPNKRKKTQCEAKTSMKRIKRADPVVVDKNDGNDSDDGHSQSSTEKPAKKKEDTTSAYGKRVGHLKSIIKSCGMSVPPNIYKNAKQAPESKREACLINELQDILAREGLSANPSEKDIKEVRRKKDRAKELEGIDMSNIVSSTRRRSTTSFIPPTPKVQLESESDDSEESDDESNSEEGNEDNSEDNNANDGSQSDEGPEDNEVDSD